MAENQPSIEFERYADDIIVHCVSRKQAEFIRRAIEERLRNCRLEVHPEKTKIVYCKDDMRKEEYPLNAFDFLGYTFRPRLAMNYRGERFITFSPAVSRKALKSMGEKIRGWKLGKRSDLTIIDMAMEINIIVQGWINYYGKFRPSGLFPIFKQLVNMQVQWVRRKYKKLRSYRKANKWLLRMAKKEKFLFVHWEWWYRMGGGITRAV